MLNDEPVLTDLLVHHQEFLIQAAELDEDVHDSGKMSPTLAPISLPQHVLQDPQETGLDFFHTFRVL